MIQEWLTPALLPLGIRVSLVDPGSIGPIPGSLGTLRS
jgi:hypothetical protein